MFRLQLQQLVVQHSVVVLVHFMHCIRNKITIILYGVDPLIKNDIIIPDLKALEGPVIAPDIAAPASPAS